MAGEGRLDSARSTRRSPSQMGMREAAYAAVERQLSKKAAARQKSRQVALSGILTLCCAVRGGGRRQWAPQASAGVGRHPALPCAVRTLHRRCTASRPPSLTVQLFPAPLQLALFVYKYHTDVRLPFPSYAMVYGGGSAPPTTEAVLAAAAAQQAAQQQPPVVLYTGASGAGAAIDSSSMSAAEISNLLKPGSSGHSPFDAPKYPGFCRKMRVGAAGEHTVP